LASSAAVFDFTASSSNSLDSASCYSAYSLRPSAWLSDAAAASNAKLAEAS